MSAFIVSKQHIDAIVSLYVTVDRETWNRGVPTPDALNKIGAMLWRANHASVNARYSEHAKTPEYEYTPCEQPIEAVFMLIRCYAYQSCEHRGWMRSRARRFVRDLVFDATALLPAVRSAPWTI